MTARVEDHRRAVRRRLVEQGGRGGRKVAVPRCDGGSRRATSTAATQPLAPLVLLGPDQVLQPRHRVGVGHVERVEVDATPPGDVGVGGRDRQRAGGPAVSSGPPLPRSPPSGGQS